MAVSDANVTQEKQTKSEQQTKWYPFFKDSDNCYINDLALRAKRSPTHGAILQSKAVYTAGEDFLYFKDGEAESFDDLDERTRKYLKEVNAERDSLHWVFYKAAYDYITTGNAYIEVNRGKEFTTLFNQDSTKVRVSETDAYITAYWREIKNNAHYSTKDYPTEILPLWDNKLETTQKKFIIHLKNDTPEYDYYGLPENVQVLKWADIEYKIVQFNLDKFKNGFFPSVAMSVFGKAPEGMTDQKYVETIRDKFTDEGNNHKIFVELLDSPDMAAKITEFTSTKQGDFEELQRLATQNIITGHRWFASLSGVQTGGQLGSNQQIRNEYNIALKSLIIPQFQKPLLKMFNEILKIAKIDVELGIMNVAPVGIEDRIEPKEILSINEQRELIGYEPTDNDSTGQDTSDSQQ